MTKGYHSQRFPPRVNFDHRILSCHLSRREPARKEPLCKELHYYRHDDALDNRYHNSDKYQGHLHRNDHHFSHHGSNNHRQSDHHHRHLAEGAIAGVGITEMVHKFRKKRRRGMSRGLGYFAHTLGASALGAVVINEASCIQHNGLLCARNSHSCPCGLSNTCRAAEGTKKRRGRRVSHIKSAGRLN